MRLPITVPHHDDEAAIDFVARLAAANGFNSLSEFLEHADLASSALISGDHDAMSMVGTWSGVAMARLEAMAVSSSSPGGAWQLGFATLNRDMRPGRTMRFCACCVVKDRLKEEGRLAARAYRRAWWSVRAIESCGLHGCSLTEVEMEAGTDLHDFPLFVLRNTKMIATAAASAERARQPRLDAYLQGRVLSKPAAGFLDGLDAHVAVELARHLGEYIASHDLQDRMIEQFDPPEWGFSVASEGADEIRAMLAKDIDRLRPRTKHVGQMLGSMSRWLRRHQDKSAYQEVVDLIQDILERNMPFGEGQIIFRPVARRHLYCLNSAHAEFGVQTKRIRALMKASDDSFDDGYSDSATYIPADVLRPILQSAADTLTSVEAAKMTGISERRVHNLVSAGIFEQVETRDGSERSYSRIKPSSVKDVLSRLEDGATPLSSADGYVSLAEATRYWNRRYHEVVATVLEGHVESYIIPGDVPSIVRIRVAPEALKHVVDPMAGGDEELMRREEAKRVLGTTNATIKALISLGYLDGRILPMMSGHKVQFIERRSMSEFQQRYATLSQIGKAFGWNPRSVPSKLKDLGISPVFEPRGAVARFFEKSELAKADIHI
ncbi:TniQ family protein [Rhizobium sp. CC-YZS058]|uniref:TniQ family protein n=1 Tax=Rhizobium sp. CC-YZS058 TaxID=3042153 RepID=UPI002B05616E|nr:TniQ family protein [Rhizobium sp. CC-YZS058]MEA3536976.1 TniQ family protein [Rhizobium sp. CC-YZS058]